jgi:broad specificity phosphatase PhoE
MTRLIFIRHGEALWNLEGREMGHLDSPLSPRGELQALAIAERLRSETFSHIYSSDLGRALQTAEAISSTCNKEIIKEPELRERNMGVWQGCTHKEIGEKYPEQLSRYNDNRWEYIIPEGESQKQRFNRTVVIMNTLAGRHKEEAVVVVSHSGVLRGFFEYVLDLKKGNEDRFIRTNATFNSFIFKNGKWALQVWGDSSHLNGMGSINDPANA